MADRCRETDTQRVKAAYPPGTRLLCCNGLTYQMGAHAGGTIFHMVCEADWERGKVDASVILGKFERMKEQGNGSNG